MTEYSVATTSPNLYTQLARPYPMAFTAMYVYKHYHVIRDTGGGRSMMVVDIRVSDRNAPQQSTNGNFLINSVPSKPLIYHVEALRTGRSYCTRVVRVRQPEPDGSNDNVMFFATVSFKKDLKEKSFEHQIPSPEFRKYFENPRKFDYAPMLDIPRYVSPCP